MKGRLEADKKDLKLIMNAPLDQANINFAGKYKEISTEEIMKLEAGPDADKYTLFKQAINNKKYSMVFDLKTKELLYNDYVNLGTKIKDKDFNKSNKAAEL